MGRAVIAPFPRVPGNFLRLVPGRYSASNMEMLMNNRKLFFVAAILIVVAMLGVDSSAANKDMVQLQTQIQALQDQMARMQQSFDERMGVMRNLVEQNTDTMNKLTTTMTQ